MCYITEKYTVAVKGRLTCTLWYENKMAYALSYRMAQARGGLEFLLTLYSLISHKDNVLSICYILLPHTGVREFYDPCNEV